MKRLVVSVLMLSVMSMVQAGLVDNFESYATGKVDVVASPPWDGITEGTGYAQIKAETGGNKYLSTGWKSGARGARRTISAIDNASVVTLFMQIFCTTNLQDTSLGLSDVVAAGTWNDLEIQLALNDGADAGHVKLFAKNSTQTVQLEVNAWYNLWTVIDQTTDKYDVYYSKGTDAATLMESGIGFRNGTSDSLVSFMALTNYRDMNYRLDNIAISNGMDLSIVPEPATMLLLGLGGLFFARKR